MFNGVNVRGRVCAAVFAATMAAVVGWQTQAGIAQTQAKPNIVVIMLDDFDVAAMNAAVAGGLAPNIKRYLVDEGITFSNAFVTSTFGSPNRATFLTGQYPHNHGEIGGDANLGSAPRFNQNSTIATWLRSAGYRTGHVGRYLSGYGWFTPSTSIPPGWEQWYGLVDPTTWSTEQYVINANGALIDVGAMAANAGIEIHQIDTLGYLGGAFVQQSARSTRPFFLVVSPTTFNRERYPGPTTYNVCPDPEDPPFNGTYWGVAQKPPARYRDTVFGDTQHFPLPHPPSFNEADISDKPLWMQNNPLLTPYEIDCLEKRYWRKLENLRGIDDLVAHLMTTLEATGALNNTVVMLTADAGDVDGQFRMPEKMAAYESSIRVPFLMRVPGGASRTVSKMVLNTDLAPTIAQFAGVASPLTMDGRSLVPFTQATPPTAWRKTALIEHVFAAWTPALGYPPNYLALRVDAPGPRTFVRYPSITGSLNRELYDLDVDPYQLTNRALDPARQAEIVQLDAMVWLLSTCKGWSCRLFENAQ